MNINRLVLESSFQSQPENIKYKKVFFEKLRKFHASTIDDLTIEQKKKFFDEVKSEVKK